MLGYVIAGVVLLLAVVLLALFGVTDIHFHRKVKPGRKRVACVGDSITYGCKIFGCFWNSYPAQLQKMLGPEYHVENFGLSDRCVQRSANKPYTKYKAYRDSLGFEPDCVILMMGHNDTKDRNWVSKEAFRSELDSLIGEYKELDSHPTVMLCIPPQLCGEKEYVIDLNRSRLDEVIGVIGSYAGELTVTDAGDALNGHPELFVRDGVHPKAKGAAVIADRICHSITGEKQSDNWGRS